MLYNINGFIRKLPADHKCGIRQSFAAFLLLTHLFFPEFLGSNDNGMTARAGGTLSPLGWATGPCRPLGGRQAPLSFFFGHGPRCKFEEKKLHLGPVAPHRATGGIFEIFQNGHIFLKFCFFKKYKKEKKSRGTNLTRYKN